MGDHFSKLTLLQKKQKNLASCLISNSKTVILGIGSNLGDRKNNIKKAIDLIPLEQKIAGNIIKTKALLPKDAPKSWDIEYLNTVVVGRPIFDVQQTFCKIKSIEAKMRRKKSKKWAPRIVDIDILFWESNLIALPYLNVPHFGATKRQFVLKPIADLLPFFVHPVSGVFARQMLFNLLKLAKRS